MLIAINLKSSYCLYDLIFYERQFCTRLNDRHLFRLENSLTIGLFNFNGVSSPCKINIHLSMICIHSLSEHVTLLNLVKHIEKYLKLSTLNNNLQMANIHDYTKYVKLPRLHLNLVTPRVNH